MNKLFSIILVALLSLPICVWAVDENATVEELVATQEQVQTINTLDDEIEAVGEDKLTNFLSSSSVFQPILALLIGLIPNCAVSVAWLLLLS